ncbi:Sialic acid-binding Ig-like lectin 15 [Labeo rohita]|uniref:Sialic acid-binding Ig-like lectin 15 n=1 Tax=Labeo rohita TaxID=84645 RepID=A0ABQ8LX68_LABRO|nr:Sialic acid-binding Ig-like lectin 15 [Labeo rohita]
MFSPKMQDSVFGLTCSQWTMKVQDQVNGTLGQNVILPCVFTHPKQNTYTGDITVKWMQGNKHEPIFQCKVHNKTNRQDINCTNPRSSQQTSLQGNPRKGDTSLRINNLQFTSASQYTCRVELNYDKFEKHTMLNINAPAQILSLSMDFEVQGMMLKCIAQGNPIPQLKWTTSSGLLENAPNKTDYSNYIVASSVLVSDQDVSACQAVNSLGQDQKTVLPNNPNCSGLLVTTILGWLLLLGLVAFILDMMRRRRAQRVMLRDIGVQQVKTSIHQTNETVYANIRTCSVGRESRHSDVYSTGALREEGKVEKIPSCRAPKIRPPGPPGPPPDIG